MGIDKYKLVGHEVVPCESLEEWAQWYESTVGPEATNSRVVQQTYYEDERMVSTVFLGMDYQWGDGPPMLFETMAFRFPQNHPLRNYQDRCSTWEQAEEMHKKACALVAVATGQ